MSEVQTIRERMALVEQDLRNRGNQIDKLQSDYRGMDSIYESFVGEIARTNENIDALREQNDKMYPIIKEIILVKGYGGIAWRILKWLAGALVAVIASWHYIEDAGRWIIEHLFKIKH